MRERKGCLKTIVDEWRMTIEVVLLFVLAGLAYKVIAGNLLLFAIIGVVMVVVGGWLLYTSAGSS